MGKSLHNLFWHLKRPNLYRHWLHKKYRMIFHKRSPLEDSAPESIARCEKEALDTAGALDRLFPGSDRVDFASLFAGELRQAKEKQEKSPFKMGGAGNCDLLYWTCELSGAKTVVETGVAYGWSSLSLLLSLDKRPGSVLHSTDIPYKGVDNDDHVGCVVPAELRQNWKIYRYPDRQGIPRILKETETFDLVHYDSDKSFAGRMWAYPVLWRHLKPGGILISDDISDNIAFFHFAESAGIDPLVVKHGDKYVGLLRKE